MSTSVEVPVIRVLTLFPDMVRAVLETSIPGRAAKAGLVRYEVVDIRDFAADKHRTVDDTAYGGGAGMIMMAPPVVDAVTAELQPQLRRAGEQMHGWRRLQIDLHFVDGSHREIDLAMAEATADLERVRASLT